VPTAGRPANSNRKRRLATSASSIGWTSKKSSERTSCRSTRSPLPSTSWKRLPTQRLAEGFRQNSQPSEYIPPHLRDFHSVFSKDSFDELPGTKPWDHAVELAPDASPKSCKVYPLSASEQKELDAFLKENLNSGRIRPSKSPMAAPVFFVKKKDGGLRLVKDYRTLNAMTIKDKYPLPLIPELIAKLHGAKYFTKLDVRWGFNNVQIKEGDEWKAAF